MGQEYHTHQHHHRHHHHHMPEEERQKLRGLSLRQRRKLISNIVFTILCIVAVAILCYIFYINKVEPEDTPQIFSV